LVELIAEDYGDDDERTDDEVEAITIDGLVVTFRL